MIKGHKSINYQKHTKKIIKVQILLLPNKFIFSKPCGWQELGFLVK